MITTLILSALLSIQDPLNDAFGDGSLVPPSSINHVAAALDLSTFTILNENTLSFELEFASLANPYDRELGFSFPIVELYIQDDDVGSGNTDMLEGSGMFLARNSYWNYAIRLSGDKAELFQAVDGGILSLGSPAIFIEGNKLSINTTINRPSAMTSYGIIGYYSPFSATGWQNIAQTNSPWSYSSTTQSLPVIDVIATSSDMQNQALSSGVLPAIASSTAPNYWSYVMLSGLFLGIIGLAMRFRFQRSTPAVKSNDSDVVPSEPAASPNNQTSVENKNDAFDSFLNSPNSTQESVLASTSKEAILAANLATNKEIKAATPKTAMPKTAKAILESVADIKLLLSDTELAEQAKQEAETSAEQSGEEPLESNEKNSHPKLFAEDDWSEDTDDVWDNKA